MGKIFLSYSHQDKELAVKLRDSMQKLGLVIVDPSVDLAVGKPVARQIMTAIEGSDFVVVVMTQASVTSAWVNQEIGMALAYGKPVISLVEEEAVPLSDVKGVAYLRLDKEQPEIAAAQIIARSRSWKPHNFKGSILEEAP